MALLTNEDFAIWYLRTSYLANIKDDVGERLIEVDSSVLNTPSFRAAGWNAEPVHRCYSPPIPTTVTSEYVQKSRIARRDTSPIDEGDEGGLVTGRHSNDTVGAAPAHRRRRKKEQLEDDDSSELSDESEDEDDSNQRAAQQIRFAKMPSRPSGQLRQSRRDLGLTP